MKIGGAVMNLPNAVRKVTTKGEKNPLHAPHGYGGVSASKNVTYKIEFFLKNRLYAWKPHTYMHKPILFCIAFTYMCIQYLHI